MRFLHTSDWQLGMTRHYLDDEAQARFSEARLDVIGRMADVATERGCEFVVVAGDVFETGQPDARTVARVFDRLSRFSVPVYLLPGNHDPYDPASIYRNPAFLDRRPDHVEVLGDDLPRRPVDGVEVIGAPWTTKRPLTDLVGDVCAAAEPSDDVLRVVVGHGAVAELSGAFDEPSIIDLGRVEQALRDGRVHYVALGDRHSCTDVGSTGRVWFSGAPEPTSYREGDAGTAVVVDLERERIEVERVVVGTWAFHHLEAVIARDADIDELETALGAISDPSRAIVKVALEGTVDLRQAARLEAILEEQGLRFGALERPRKDQDVVIRPSDGDLSGLGLAGYAADASDALQRAAAQDGPDAEVAADALGLLLRLAGDRVPS